MHVKETLTISNNGKAPVLNNVGKNVIFKNFAPFNDCVSKINNTQVNNAKDIVLVMPLYNLIEYSDIYSKTFGSLWQYYRDEPALNNAEGIIVFLIIIIIIIIVFRLNIKKKTTGQTDNDDTNMLK